MATEMLNFIDGKGFNEEMRKIQNNILYEIEKKNDLEINGRFEELRLCLSNQFWINLDAKEVENE